MKYHRQLLYPINLITKRWTRICEQNFYKTILICSLNPCPPSYNVAREMVRITLCMSSMYVQWDWSDHRFPLSDSQLARMSEKYFGSSLKHLLHTQKSNSINKWLSLKSFWNNNIPENCMLKEITFVSKYKLFKHLC